MRPVTGDNPWAPWGLIYTLRDGFPVLTETALWELRRLHPEVIEADGPDQLYLHLDQPYRLVRLPDRAFGFLVPAPGRPRPGVT
jgi:hypothetical protein